MVGRKRVVLVMGEGLETHASEGVLSSLQGEFALLSVPLEPPVRLSSFAGAAAIVIDARADALVAMAEAARLRDAGLPMGLLTRREADEIAALRAGISATLREPFNEAELKSFCRKLNRRSLSRATSIALGADVFVDRLRRTLIVEGHEQELSAQKFDLLCYFIDHEGTAVGANELVRCGILRPSQAQRFKGLIKELRARLGSCRDRLRAVPGYGYRLDFFEPSSD
jgi:DNA-binding response OmpR family regulator